jgi:hypothetical protein
MRRGLHPFKAERGITEPFSLCAMEMHQNPDHRHSSLSDGIRGGGIMQKTFTHVSAAVSALFIGLAPTAPALAHERGYHRYETRSNEGHEYRRGYEDWHDHRRYEDRRGYGRHRYDRVQSYRQREEGCGKGTTGLVIGAVAGGLLGRAVAGRDGDRTAGAIIGGGTGALAGRAIDRSDDRCRR